MKDYSMGACFRQARERANLTQKEVMDRAGISVEYISKIENNQREATLRTLNSLAGALGQKVSITLDGDTPKFEIGG